MRAYLDCPYNEEGEWRKASLHCHSTKSDGDLSPAEVARFYREQGYSILAVTDHRCVTPMGGFSSEGFLCLDAIECSSPHMVGLGLFSEVRDDYGLQSQVDVIGAHGGLAIVAHPAWTGLHVDDIAGFSGHVGIEIYNAGTEGENRKGLSLNYWDELLDRGQRAWGFAVDDAHRYKTGAAKAWIEVRCDQLTRGSVMAAIRAGNFYASTGPKIERVWIKSPDDELPTICIRCSPCREIAFVGTANYGQVLRDPTGALCEAEHRIMDWPWVNYVRIECLADEGRRAWTNPIFVNWEQ